jgi:cytochrome b561
MQSSKRYHPALVTMHWLIALLVFVNLYLGIVVFENRGGGPGGFQNPLVTIHMAVGITIVLLLIVRFILRVRTNRPIEATTGNKVFDSLAKFVHYCLYVMVLTVTVLGLVFSLQTGRFQSAFLGAQRQFTPPNGIPQLQGTPGAGPFTPPTDGTGAFPEGGPGPGFQGGPGGVFGLLVIHELAAYALLVLVALHILAALYHQFVLRDHLIARMWYGAAE